MAGPGARPEQNGGFDLDFVTTPPKHLCCAICLHVLRDPHQTDCGHHFCLSCITKAYQQSHACPVCKEMYSIFRDQKVARDVKQLQVRCSQRNQGCDWVGELGNYINNHHNQCEFVNVSCTQCQQLVPKRLITKHQNFLCPLRQSSCDYCRTYVSTYDNVTKNHWPICEFYPVPCPNDCPIGSVARNRLMEHIRNDCIVKKEAKQVVEMRSQNAKLLKKLQNLTQELETKDETIKELEKKVNSLQSGMDELQLSEDEEYKEHSCFLTENLSAGPASLPDALSQEPKTETWRTMTWPRRMQRLEHQQVERKFTPETNMKQKTRIHSDPTDANLLQDPDVLLEWNLCQPLPENMVDGHAVVIGEFVYAGGGTNGDIVYKYHIKNNNWATLPKANRQKFAMVCYNSQLILIGGKGLRAEYCNSLLVWDEQTHMWTDGLYPPMDTARMQPTALSHKEHIIVAGGKNALLTSLDSVEVFDGSEWYYVAPLPVKIHSAKAALFENQLYLMGGNGQKRAVYCAPLDSLNENCPPDVWGSITESDSPNATIVTFRNTLIALGGSAAMGSTNAVRGYFTGTKTWLRLNTPLPRPLCAATAVVMSPEELLVIGGRSGAISYKSVYKVTLKYTF